jgi:hypothetical protein
MTTKITDQYFQFGGQKYFRGNAHLVELATFGEKKDPLGSKAYLDPQSKVKQVYLNKNDRVSKSVTIDVDWDRTTKADLGGNGSIKVFGLNISLANTFSYEKVRSAKLKLLNLSIPEAKLIAMLNQDADTARKYLADEGKDGRIVSEVWVVLEAELAEHFDTSGSLEVSAKDDDLNVTVKGGKHGSQTITLSKGSTFAYKLHKVKNWSNGKKRIEDMEADYHGMG